MLKRPSEMTVEIREKMRGGNGDVKFQNIFNPDEIMGKCRLFSQITLEPGCSIGAHVHDQEEEIYYILSGTGTVNDNGVVKNVGPGDAIKTGDGESHSISNNGDVPLVFLAAIILF